MAVKIEFLRWYQPGTEVYRCGGDDGCGALVVSGDMDLHSKWHDRVEKPKPSWGKTKGSW